MRKMQNAYIRFGALTGTVEQSPASHHRCDGRKPAVDELTGCAPPAPSTDASGAGVVEMAGAAPSAGQSPLVGRRSEMRRVLDILKTEDRGSRTLLLLGEDGTGKTSLMAAAADHARGSGWVVLTCRGSEAESQQSFASLHQLLLPILPEAGTLAGHLREALESAVGLGLKGGRPGPMLRSAVLTSLTGVSAQRPVLLAVDDVQHFDRDSLDVLRFVLRRVAMEDVSVLLAARGQSPPAGVAGDVPTLLLGPLAEQAAAELVDAQPFAPVGRARIDVLEQARGNPLAIVELCRAAGVGGARALPGGGLSQTRRIQEMYVARLGALPQVTRRLMVYAAASECEDLATIMAAAGVGRDLSVWAPAEGAGLVS
ncbi:ATP-binding protein, partial [Thermocatellispora tengchongensis]